MKKNTLIGGDDWLYSLYFIWRRGENVLADLGSGVYTRQYFNEERYEHLHTGSQGHSVPIIEGCLQKAGREYFAEVLHYRDQEKQIEFGLDLTKAYDCARLEMLRREFVWEKCGNDLQAQLLIRDTFAFTELPESIVEVFISSVQPQVVERGKLQIGLVAMLFDPDRFDVNLEHIQEKAHDGSVTDVWRILLHAVRPEIRTSYEFRFLCNGFEKLLSKG